MQDPKSAFGRLDRTVRSIKTVTAQVNEVLRVLDSHGYRRSPEIQEGWVTAKVGEHPVKMQFFVWLDTPYGDDVILATGPSVEPWIGLGASVPKTPVGMYVTTLLAQAGGKGSGSGGTRAKSERAEDSSRQRAKTGSGASTVKPGRAKTPSAGKAASAPPPPMKSIPHRAPDRSVDLVRARGEDRAAASMRERAKEAQRKAQERIRAAEEQRALEEAAAAALEAQEQAARVAAEARAAGERKVAQKAEAAKREAAEFLQFLEAELERG